MITTMIAHLDSMPHAHIEHVVGFLVTMFVIGVVGMIATRKEK